MSLDSRDLSILTQVAFKAAVDSAAVGVFFGEDGTAEVSESHATTFEATFAYYQRTLLSAVEAATSSVSNGNGRPAKAQTSRPTYDAAQRVRDEFGAEEVDYMAEDEGFELELRGGDGSPAPSWLIADAMEAGVTAVWDNRAKATGNQPLFKEVVSRGARGHGKGGEPKAFWAPK